MADDSSATGTGTRYQVNSSYSFPNFGPKKNPNVAQFPKFHPQSEMPSKVPNSQFWIGSTAFAISQTLLRKSVFPEPERITPIIIIGSKLTF